MISASALRVQRSGAEQAAQALYKGRELLSMMDVSLANVPESSGQSRMELDLLTSSSCHCLWLHSCVAHCTGHRSDHHSEMCSVLHGAERLTRRRGFWCEHGVTLFFNWSKKT